MRLDPFFDWSRMPEELAVAYRDELRKIRDCHLVIAERPLEVSELRDAIGREMGLHRRIEQLVREIPAACLVVPMLVHTAGLPEWEGSEHLPIEDDHQHLVQRCSRCKSVLIEYCDAGTMAIEGGLPRIVEGVDDIDWVPGGSQVAKAPQEGNATVVRLADSSEPEPHHHPCVGL